MLWVASAAGLIRLEDKFQKPGSFNNKNIIECLYVPFHSQPPENGAKKEGSKYGK